nr:hypothetical protein [Candidatus Gastranaerophilales bacterium]
MYKYFFNNKIEENPPKTKYTKNVYDSKGGFLYILKYRYKYIGKNVIIVTETCKQAGLKEVTKRVFRIDKVKMVEKEYNYSPDGKQTFYIKRYFNKKGELVKEQEYCGKEYRGTSYHLDKEGNYIRPYFVSAWQEKSFNGIISNNGILKPFSLHESITPTKLF